VVLFSITGTYGPFLLQLGSADMGVFFAASYHVWCFPLLSIENLLLHIPGPVPSFSLVFAHPRLESLRSTDIGNVLELSVTVL